MQMVSSLDNWDGSLSKTVKQPPARVIDLLDSNDGTSTLNKTQDHTIGIRQDMVDVNRMVCSLSDVFCICGSSRGQCRTTRQI